MKYLLLFILIGCKDTTVAPQRDNPNKYNHYVIKGNFYIDRYYSSGMYTKFEIKDSAVFDIPTTDNLHCLLYTDKPKRLVFIKNNKVLLDSVCSKYYINRK